MNIRVQTVWLLAALGLLTGCVGVREPGLREMRVTKDGTEILLEQPYAKVKADLEVVAAYNNPTPTGWWIPPISPELRSSLDPNSRGVWEPATGRVCRLTLFETMGSTISSHLTQIEARWIAEGLTHVRVKSESSRMSLLLGLFSPKHAWMHTRKTGVERKRLLEVVEATQLKPAK